MSDYSTKNYTAQGGNLTVIGGELRILGKLTVDPGAEIVGLFDTLPEAELMGIGPTPAQPDSTATSAAQLRADFNLLLANLRAAGILAASDEVADTLGADSP